MSHKNTEGYADPTAGIAMSRMMRDYRQKQKQRFSNRNRKRSMWHPDLPVIPGPVFRPIQKLRSGTAAA